MKLIVRERIVSALIERRLKEARFLVSHQSNQVRTKEK
jgi:hypothetical protein